VMKQFAEALNRKLREDMNNYADDVATGSCRSFEDYKRLCGVIEGLAIAERHLKDLLAKLENDDDSD
jgi:hypothetical protein